MTRLVVCCDGTWNRPDQVSPTNVSKVALGLAEVGADGVAQTLFYHRGVGTSRSQPGPSTARRQSRSPG